LSLYGCEKLEDRWYCADGHEFEAASGIMSLFKRNKCAHCKMKKSQHRFVPGLPDTIGNLENLQELNLAYCRNLAGLPDTIGNLENLQNLNLADCRSLAGLPDTVGDLKNLQTLDLSSCAKLEGNCYRLSIVVPILHHTTH